MRANFSLLIEGYAGLPPGPCCELGFGQGVSLAMHATANPARRWWGTDFNPGHAVHAAELLQAAGVDAAVEEQSFAEFCARDDLPSFAYISLHGVWSWISDQNRKVIVDFLRRKLMPGGVAMISYNTMPGWAPMLPLRHLLLQHAQLLSPPGRPELARMAAALEFASRLWALEPMAVQNNPTPKDRLARLQRQSKNYLLHEFMNRDWHPQSFSDVAQQLGEAKLSYACSTWLLDRVTELELGAEHLELLQEIEHPGFRETVRDMITDRRFRCDLWVRGMRRMGRLEHLQRIEATRVVLGMNRANVPTFISGARGDVQLAPEPLACVLDSLAQADAPLPLGDILDLAASQGLEIDSVVSVVAMLVGMGAVHPAQSAQEAHAARACCRSRRHRFAVQPGDRRRSHVGNRATRTAGRL